MSNLHFTIISKGIIPVIPDDDMIQDIHVKHEAAIPQLFGQFTIGLTGLDVPGGMIVPEDDRTGLIIQAGLENFFGIHYRSGYSAFGNADLPQYPI